MFRTILNLRIRKSMLQTVKLHTMKLPHTDLEKIQRPGLNELSELFTKNGYTLRLAGGPVRDLLMGKTPEDLDFATDATPTAMKEFFNKEEVRLINMNGEKHGTITPRICDTNFECTTLRLDKTTDGRHAEVEFITDWELDAGRRDLTINAMFLDLDGTVYDYFNGIEDLKLRRVRFVGDAEKRITEDYLRILRYFRFFGRIAQSSDDFEPQTIETIKNNVSGLSIISKERLWVEFKKILMQKFGGVLLLKMQECGILSYLGLPDNFNCNNVKALYDKLDSATLKELHVSSILAHGLTAEDASKFCDVIKSSNKERHLMEWMSTFVNIRSDAIDEDFVVKQFTTLRYLDKIPMQNIHLILSDTLRIHGKTELLQLLEDKRMPIMPKVSNLVKDRIKNKKLYKHIIDMACRVWIDSKYTKTAEELINEVLSEEVNNR